MLYHTKLLPHQLDLLLPASLAKLAHATLLPLVAFLSADTSQLCCSKLAILVVGLAPAQFPVLFRPVPIHADYHQDVPIPIHADYHQDVAVSTPSATSNIPAP